MSRARGFEQLHTTYQHLFQVSGNEHHFLLLFVGNVSANSGTFIPRCTRRSPCDIVCNQCSNKLKSGGYYSFDERGARSEYAHSSVITVYRVIDRGRAKHHVPTTNEATNNCIYGSYCNESVSNLRALTSQ